MIESKTVEELEELERQPDLIQKKVEAAFISSNGVRQVAGISFKPYSPSMEVAAQAMGLHYAYVDKIGQERFRRTMLYPGALRDVSIIMWLGGAATEEEIDSAGIEPKLAARAAIRWAKEHNLLDTSQESFWLCFKFFFDLMDEVYVSRSVPEQKKITSLEEAR